MLIATDMDRTLLPNGKQEYDGSMEKLKSILKEHGFTLAFVTGRHLGLIRDAMKEYDTPRPDYIISDVGTMMYEGQTPVEEWNALIKDQTKGWDVEKFRQSMQGLALRLQEEDKLNEYKLSYYMDKPYDVQLVKRITKTIRGICSDAVVVYSVDEAHDVGLIDILPKVATKLGALEFLRNRLGLEKKEVYYCGDSGNDILPLTFGYKAILVRNAITDVRDTVRQLSIQKNIINNLHIAKGMGSLNGYYVSGIIEGLIKYGVIDRKWSD